MKKSTAIKAAIGVLAVGVLASVGSGGSVLNFGLAADEDPPPPAETNGPGNGKLTAADIGEEGWQDIISPPGQETRETKGKPRLSNAAFTTQFVCYRAADDPDADPIPEVINFEPAHEDAESHRGAFRKAGAGAPRGGSKLLAQHIAVYSNDGGGGLTGVEKARAVLEQLRTILEDETCTRLEVRSQDRDPDGDGPGQAEVRVWDVVPQADPELGDTPGPGEKKHALHFRALTTIGSNEGVDPETEGTEPVGIENDFIVIQRGRTLILMVETSPSGYENAAAEALNHAGNADGKMVTNGNGGN
jgi:hypothetical protein